MGWFKESIYLPNKVAFSSPSGDGLVPDKVKQRYYSLYQFSSPSGDGLVRKKPDQLARKSLIFVPEWGWVGSQIIAPLCFNRMFSSPSGDGLVPYCLYPQNREELIFVPEWGWVGSIKIRQKL